MKPAIIGASGYIGGWLLRRFRARHPDCVGTSHSRSLEGLVSFDLRTSDPEDLHLVEKGHDAILLCAAKPNIAFCENDPEGSRAVNVEGTLRLVRHAARHRMRLVFLSTDYVFEGRQGRYPDDAVPDPRTEYGRQKAAVEKAIPGLIEDHLILRLSKIYGTAKGDNTLLDEMAAQLTAGKTLRAAADQFFCPTHVSELTDAVERLLEGSERGTMNVCSPERWCRYDMALRLAEKLGIDRARVERIALHDIPAMAGRPLDTSMVCARLEAVAPTRFTPFVEHIDQVAGNWRSNPLT